MVLLQQYFSHMRKEWGVIWQQGFSVSSPEYWYKTNEAKVFPAIHHVSVACEARVMAHNASIVWLQLEREKTSVLQYEQYSHTLWFPKLLTN